MSSLFAGGPYLAREPSASKSHKRDASDLITFVCWGGEAPWRASLTDTEGAEDFSEDLFDVNLADDFADGF